MSKRKIYDVLDVSHYVINYSNNKRYGVSNLKLQKLLYFIQAYFLIIKKSPCFDSRIEAWDFGVVVPEVYREYRFFGSCNIPDIPSQNISIPISRKDRKRIEQVVDFFVDYSATDLLQITCKQKPWEASYKEGQNNEITIESMQEYFNKK